MGQSSAWSHVGRGGALVLSSMAAVSVAGCQGHPPGPPPKPNVLLILLEGVGTRLGAYDQQVRTPHIDALARRGRLFERAYRQYPAAGAARASLLSGRRTETTRVWGELASRRDLGDAVPLPEHFRAHGYFTARAGPVYGGPAEGQFTWDAAEDVAEPARVVRFLEEHRAGPFFIAAGLARPGVTTAVPREVAEMYDPARIRLPVGLPAGLPRLATADEEDATRPIAPPVPEEERRQALAAEYARIALVDAQVGMVLDALDRLRLRDRTIVALASVDAAPVAGRARQDLLLEGTLRSALVIATPGQGSPGVPSDALVELVDVHPTLTRLCGLPDAPGLEGTSLVPVLADPGRAVKSAAFSVVHRVASTLGRSVRTERHRYTEWPDGSRELYDDEADPQEHTNLARAPSQASRVRELGRMLAEGYRGALLPPPVPAHGRARKPNVLFVVIDDLNVHLGGYGYDVRTPQIDRLAAEGRRFERAYCQIPSCNPSRTSFMTGWRPERTGVWDNLQTPRGKLAGAVPLQEHFHANGYFTARVGKIYHGPFEDEFHWDLAEHTPYLPEDAENEPLPRRERLARGGPVMAWTATNNRDEDEPDGRAARRVAQLLASHRDRPFFIAAGFNKPHIHWVAPKKYFDMYPPASIRLPAEPADDWADIPEIALARRTLRFPRLMLAGPVEPMDDEVRREGVAAYSACVSFADAQVGVLLEALDRLRLRERTIVVVMSDHGFHLGEHSGLWRKNTLFEESVRVPLVMAAPGMAEPGVATASLAELVDVYPTLVELAGLPAVPGLEGVSLVPVLEDPRRAVKQAAFSVASRLPPELGWSVRTERYRYTLWPDGTEELYDLSSPGPWTRLRGLLAGKQPPALANLASDPRYVPTVADLRRRLEAGPAAAAVAAPAAR